MDGQDKSNKPPQLFFFKIGGILQNDRKIKDVAALLMSVVLQKMPLVLTYLLPAHAFTGCLWLTCCGECVLDGETLELSTSGPRKKDDIIIIK